MKTFEKGIEYFCTAFLQSKITIVSSVRVGAKR